VLDQLIQLHESTFVKEQFHTLARRELAFLMLLRAALFTTALFRGGMAAVQFFE
jgi:hypothetical protein